jgi:hypothetical protein
LLRVHIALTWNFEALAEGGVGEASAIQECGALGAAQLGGGLKEGFFTGRFRLHFAIRFVHLLN